MRGIHARPRWTSTIRPWDTLVATGFKAVAKRYIKKVDAGQPGRRADEALGHSSASQDRLGTARKGRTLTLR